MKQISTADDEPVYRRSNHKSTTIYKVTVSIIFGLLGFVVNFYTINFAFPPYTAVVLIGLLFPMLISVLGSLIFHPESSFLDLLALNIPPYEVYVRTFFILACLAGGLLASKLLRTQRESDRALWESEKKLSQIVEGSSTPMFVIDEKHTVTHWNKACENLTGISAVK